MSISATIYQIDDDTLLHFETLEPADLGRWYFVCHGSLMIYNTPERAERVRSVLVREERRIAS